jgi:hypothetical protein
MGNAWLEVGKKFLELPAASRNWAGAIFSYERAKTFDGGAYTFSLGYNWASNYTGTGDETKFVESVTPGLFTSNSDGTVTLNPGFLQAGDFILTVVHPLVMTPGFRRQLR